MISQENYDILKEKYGDASSWAVWNTDYAGIPSPAAI